MTMELLPVPLIHHLCLNSDSLSRALRYLAPEILMENTGVAAPVGYDKAVDLWSLGCVLYIL